MLDWLRLMTHPGGALCFFNDSANGIALTHQQLKEYSGLLGIEIEPKPKHVLRVLEESGYVIAQSGGAKLQCNAAPIHPDYQPGHAHADTLSFEMSFNGEAFLVNSDVSTYSEGEDRQFQWSTAAHNTVDVDNEDSSEVWKGFRVARRARPFGLMAEDRGSCINIDCKHDGFTRLGRACINRRTWDLTENCLKVADQLEG